MPKDIHPVLPEDDYAVYQGRREVLNRIDEQYPCQVIIATSAYHGAVYCGTPEWEPWSEKCYDHTPGVMHSWDM